MISIENPEIWAPLHPNLVPISAKSASSENSNAYKLALLHVSRDVDTP